MSKITFRADEDLVDAVEELDASKSEIMRDALRRYLASDSGPDAIGHRPVEESLDDLVTRRVNEMLDDRLNEGDEEDSTVNVYVEVDGAAVRSATTDQSPEGTVDAVSGRMSDANAPAETGGTEGRTCVQCGVELEADHVYCPNCGEHAGRGTFCECGAELEPQWSFCPGCGRRTVPAEFIDR